MRLSAVAIVPAIPVRVPTPKVIEVCLYLDTHYEAREVPSEASWR